MLEFDKCFFFLFSFQRIPKDLFVEETNKIPSIIILIIAYSKNVTILKNHLELSFLETRSHSNGKYFKGREGNKGKRRGKKSKRITAKSSTISNVKKRAERERERGEGAAPSRK